MSHTHNQNYRLWKDISTTLRCIPSIREGKALTNNDSATVSHAILLNAMILKDIGSDAPRRSVPNLKSWCITTKQLDILHLDQLMKECTTVLLKHDCTSYEDFKHLLSIDNHLVGAFVAPVKDYLVRFLEEPNASDFKVLNQFLSFMTRICLQDVDFSSISLQAYYETEERLKLHEYCNDELHAIREVIQEWWKDFKLDLSSYDGESGLNCSHGPGSTAFLSSPSVHDKFSNLSLDRRLSYLTKDMDLSEVFPHVSEGDLRTAEVVFVPKNLSSQRTICKEPTSLMYFQQGCWDQIQRYMESHKDLRKSIRLSDQSYNRKRSKIGSATQKYATIDLSAASDSLSWELMKYAFKGTDYYKAALLTRSEFAALPDGKTISLQKFAPMGSTFCFPTQCIVFAAICESVAREMDIHEPECYSVYGDDLVILESMVPAVVRRLEALGFIVNTSKSFFTGRFKESCGGEYFDGYDVTPLKLPRNYNGKRLSKFFPSLYTGLIDFINSCQTRGYKWARLYLISRFDSLPRSLYPLFDDGKRGIASDTCSNYKLQTRVSHRLQISRYEHGDVTSVTSPRVDDEIYYFIWHYLARRRRVSKYAFKVPEDTITVKPVSKTVLRSTLSLDPQGSEDYAYQRVLENLSKRP